MDGLIIADSQSYEDVIIESDSFAAVQELQSPNSGSYWFSMVSNILQLANSVARCSFSFVYRDCNRLARDLAHHHIGDRRIRVWNLDGYSASKYSEP